MIVLIHIVLTIVYASKELVIIILLIISRFYNKHKSSTPTHEEINGRTSELEDHTNKLNGLTPDGEKKKKSHRKDKEIGKQKRKKKDTDKVKDLEETNRKLNGIASSSIEHPIEPGRSNDKALVILDKDNMVSSEDTSSSDDDKSKDTERQ